MLNCRCAAWQQSVYTEADLHVGARVKLHDRIFELLEADMFTEKVRVGLCVWVHRYMSACPDEVLEKLHQLPFAQT